VELGKAYEEYKRKVKESMEGRKAAEVRNAVFKWIGAKTVEVEQALEKKDVDALADIAVEALATLEAYLEVMEERARRYSERRNAFRRGGYGYRRGGGGG